MMSRIVFKNRVYKAECRVVDPRSIRCRYPSCLPLSESEDKADHVPDVSFQQTGDFRHDVPLTAF